MRLEASGRGGERWVGPAEPTGNGGRPGVWGRGAGRKGSELGLLPATEGTGEGRHSMDTATCLAEGLCCGHTALGQSVTQPSRGVKYAVN